VAVAAAPAPQNAVIANSLSGHEQNAHAHFVLKKRKGAKQSLGDALAFLYV
jgi:hypothetical protein